MPDSETPVVGRPRRALVVAADPVGREMRGTAIRNVEFARALSGSMDVTLMAPEFDDSRPVEGIEYLGYEAGTTRAIERAVDEHDVVVTPSQPPGLTRHMQRAEARLIVDLYAPEHFEAMERLADRPGRLNDYRSRLVLDRINAALAWADVLLCGTERQRDLWLGAMLSAGLIDLHTYQRDPTYEGVLPIVPSGVPPERPSRMDGVSIRDRFPAIGRDTEVILWNGGVWSWLDPEVAIAATEILIRRDRDVALVFMGVDPDATVRVTGMADDKKLLNAGVYLNEGWLPYGDRATWLLEADCAVSAHRLHLETRFSFRTRLLDCFWTGLPIVCTRGDVLAEMVDEQELGAAVPASDPLALADAIDAVLRRGKRQYAAALGRAAEHFAWSHVTEPLVEAATAEDVPREVRGAPRIETDPGRAARWSADRMVRGVMGRLKR
ncbi:MAG: glycosyltransferase [Miltoncostaeaceae bacterium]